MVSKEGASGCRTRYQASCLLWEGRVHHSGRILNSHGASILDLFHILTAR